MASALHNPSSLEESFVCSSNKTGRANVVGSEGYFTPRDIWVSCQLDRLETASVNDFITVGWQFIEMAVLRIVLQEEQKLAAMRRVVPNPDSLVGFLSRWSIQTWIKR